MLSDPTNVVDEYGKVNILVVSVVIFADDNFIFFVSSIEFINVVGLSSKFLFVNIWLSVVPTKLPNIPWLFDIEFIWASIWTCVFDPMSNKLLWSIVCHDVDDPW